MEKMPEFESEKKLSPEEIKKENEKLDEIQEGLSVSEKKMFIKAREKYPPIIYPCGTTGFRGGFTPGASGEINFWFNDIDQSTHIITRKDMNSSD